MLVVRSGLSMRQALFIVLKQLFLVNEVEDFSFEQQKKTLFKPCVGICHVILLGKGIRFIS